MQLDIGSITDKLLKSLEQEREHFLSMSDGVKLLYNAIQEAAKLVENGREEIKHSKSVTSEKSE